ncbi:hypothetical protein OBK28_03985, partial [Empedobacter falsenii]
ILFLGTYDTPNKRLQRIARPSVGNFYYLIIILLARERPERNYLSLIVVVKFNTILLKLNYIKNPDNINYQDLYSV